MIRLLKNNIPTRSGKYVVFHYGYDLVDVDFEDNVIPRVYTLGDHTPSPLIAWEGAFWSDRIEVYDERA